MKMNKDQNPAQYLSEDALPQKYPTDDQIAILRKIIKKEEEKEVLKNEIVKEIRQQQKRGRVWELPVNTKWEDITIRFKDEDNIEIRLKTKHLAFSNYKEMRFGKNKPDKRWNLLRRLAAIYAANKQRKHRKDMPATVDDIAQSLLGRMSPSAKTNVHTIKKALSFQLQQDFGIDDEPFDDYNQWGYYKTKFNLIPEQDLRWFGKEGVYSVDRKLRENRNYESEERGSENYDNENYDNDIN